MNNIIFFWKRNKTSESQNKGLFIARRKVQNKLLVQRVQLETLLKRFTLQKAEKSSTYVSLVKQAYLDKKRKNAMHYHALKNKSLNQTFYSHLIFPSELAAANRWGHVGRGGTESSGGEEEVPEAAVPHPLHPRQHAVAPGTPASRILNLNFSKATYQGNITIQPYLLLISRNCVGNFTSRSIWWMRSDTTWSSKLKSPTRRYTPRLYPVMSYLYTSQ